MKKNQGQDRRRQVEREFWTGFPPKEHRGYELETSGHDTSQNKQLATWPQQRTGNHFQRGRDWKRLWLCFSIRYEPRRPGSSPGP